MGKSPTRRSKPKSNSNEQTRAPETAREAVERALKNCQDQEAGISPEDDACLFGVLPEGAPPDLLREFTAVRRELLASYHDDLTRLEADLNLADLYASGEVKQRRIAVVTRKSPVTGQQIRYERVERGRELPPEITTSARIRRRLREMAKGIEHREVQHDGQSVTVPAGAERLMGRLAAQSLKSRRAGEANLRKRHQRSSRESKSSILDKHIEDLLLTNARDSNSVSKLVARYSSLCERKHRKLLQEGKPGLPEKDRKITGRQVRNRMKAIAHTLFGGGQTPEKRSSALPLSEKRKSRG